jgi:hypothetical protein
VTFFRSGSSDVAATVSSVTATSIACSVDVTGMAAGAWDVRVINPVNKTGTLASAFTVLLPSVSSVTPNTGMSGDTAVTVTGQSFAPGATVTFFRSGSSDVAATVSSVTPTNIFCSVNVTGMVAGPWDVRVTNPGGKTGTLASCFTVVSTLAAQDFDPDAPGWTTSVTLGDPPSGWALSTLSVHTAPNAYWIAPPSTRKTDNLISEGIAIPSGAQDLRLHFWHRYYTETYDGGIMELSDDNGATWKGVGTTGSGTAFLSGGYTGIIDTQPSRTAAELSGQLAWRGPVGGAFTEVVISLDPTVFAGKILRTRWRMSTDSKNGNSTYYWYVDSVRITGYVPRSPAKGTIILIYTQ